MARTFRVHAIALALVLLAPRARAGNDEHWYRVLMSGAPAGWSYASESTADGKVTSKGEMSFHVRRGPIDLAITMRSEFVETADGKPVSMTTHQELGAQPVDTRCTFTPDNIQVETTQSGLTTKSTRALPKGDWLCPAAAGRELRDRLAKGDKEIRLRTIEPVGGSDMVTMDHKVIGPDSIVVGGKTLNVTKTTVETTPPGMTSTEYVDDQGVSVRSDTDFGGFKMTLVKAGPEVKDETGEAPELMVSTFVRPDRPIERPRKLKSGAYTLTVNEGPMPDLPETGAQSVDRVEGGAVRVRVDASGPNAAPAAEVEDARFSAGSAAANIEDPEIKKLVKRALRNAGEDKAERAETLRRFVFRFIKNKNLDVGMATASEVARTKSGDCSEHGVLLAALLRADGIPSRVAVGVEFVDAFAGESGIFGYHMWAQALLDKDGRKRWVDLDGTLPDSTPFDATHITLGTSNLADEGGMDSMAGLVKVLGALKIQVDEPK